MIIQESGQDFSSEVENNEQDHGSRKWYQTRSLLPTKLLRNWLHTLLPAVLILLVLVLFNWQLRTRLGPDESFSTFDFPYYQPFDDLPVNRWFRNGGTWVIEGSNLVQSDREAGLATIFVPRWLPEGEPYYASIEITLSENGQAAGLAFNGQYPEIHFEHQRVYISREEGQTQIVTGSVDKLDGFAATARKNLPADVNTFQLELLVGSQTYEVWLDGEPIFSDQPLQYHDGLLGFVATGAPVKFDDLSVSDPSNASLIEDQNVSESAEAGLEEKPISPPEDTSLPGQVDDVVVNQESGTGITAVEVTTAEQPAIIASPKPVSGLEEWVVISGQWSSENGKLVQNDAAGIDLAAGFAGNTFSSLDLEVSVDHLEGIGAGLLFHMPSINALQGAHMVRFADWADALVWGYFDELGQFTGQGYAKIDPPAGNVHRLRVKSDSQSYTLFLDGQQLAAGVPLKSANGHIGLVTSKSKAAFPSITMAGSEQLVTGNQGSAGNAEAAGNLFGDIETISGDWVREGTTLSQVNPAKYDFAVSTGVFAGVYTLETEIILPQDPALADAGGGILFHMSERNSRSGAHMVRFTGKDGLIWGYYDQNGTFNGQGRAAVAASAKQNHQLEISVAGESYRIQVDGQIVAENVALKQTGGWIGLISYRGPVVFNGVRVTFGTE